jgi:hypothetical protein
MNLTIYLLLFPETFKFYDMDITDLNSVYFAKVGDVVQLVTYFIMSSLKSY